MAKKSTANRAAEGAPPERKPAPGAAPPSDPLVRLRRALVAGNVRAARAVAREIAAAGPDAERPEALGLLDRTAPDPRALITTLTVIALILFAAWAAIFRVH